MLIILIVYNPKFKKLELCLISTFTQENKDFLFNFTVYLNTKKYIKKRIICNFSKTVNETIKIIYNERDILIIIYFFHLKEGNESQ